jgi:very-short-patch-repair endonuclease
MANASQELINLRDNIAKIISGLEVWTTLHDVCRSLDLPIIENTTNLGKEKYLHKITSEASESSIINAAQKILSNYPGTREKPSASDLQSLQDSLWWIESDGVQKLSNVTRYRVAESLEGVRFWGRLGLRDIFASTVPSAEPWVFPDIGNDGYLYLGVSSSAWSFLLDGSKSDSPNISRISVQDFLTKIGLISWPDKRFCLLIERIVHPEVQPSESQEQIVIKFNEILQSDSYELRREGSQSGQPVYKVRRKDLGVSGPPKYIIFAADGPKPDIVIADAVNMDIRIVRFADKCLIYDQPPPDGDLTWQMLLEWWGKKKSSDPDNENLRRDFGLRLQASLQSPPERMLFTTYFKVFKPKMGNRLPALLPQVYLHYDPRYKSERDRPVLTRQRMDFLLLLRNSARIVIEVDGIQHYSEDDGKASTTKYAEMVAEDRRIRLLGYEIYRFGGAELTSSTAQRIIIDFFEELFKRHGL